MEVNGHGALVSGRAPYARVEVFVRSCSVDGAGTTLGSAGV